MKYLLLAGILIALLCLYQTSHKENAMRYIPIGDSYTIGEGVQENERWPNLLAKQLTESGTPIELLENPGRTGWTTQDALDRELPIVEKERPNLITVLIGVNDLVQGISLSQFQKIIVITIPDFTLTPAGKSFGDQAAVQEKLAEFNRAIREEAAAKNIPVADIYVVSLKLGENPKYTGEDGLHPSPTAYIEWEKEIYRALVKKI